ncbi:MAG TPA: hypothetical protein PLJ83_11445 [Spirochaetales bacterium]|nr:hypothetical protein [Spirochaetales bacterium]
MTTKKINSKEKSSTSTAATSSMTRNEAVSLFMMIRDIKNGSLSREALVKYVMLRVKLKALYDEYERVRQEISEQTKPEGWKEGDAQDEWNEAFRPVMEAWLKEPSNIDTKIFTESDCADLIMSNPDKTGTFVDVVMEYLKK